MTNTAHTYKQTADLARSMYLAENPRGIFEAEDESVIGYWMRRAALRGRLPQEPRD